MKGTELLRLVWLNINQNKFKSVMTSIGIVAGAATIVMVIAIGRGGQMDVAEQFSNLNAGAIDISYEWAGSSGSGSGFENMGQFFFGGSFGGKSMGMSGNRQTTGNDNSGTAQMPSGGTGVTQGSRQMPSDGEAAETEEFQRSRQASADGTSFEKNDGSENAAEESEEESSVTEERVNQEEIILTVEDAEEIEALVPEVSAVTISYTVKTEVEGGLLTEAENYTAAGVKENFLSVSSLSMECGEFISEEQNLAKSRVCVLGASAAKNLFGSAEEAYESSLYIDDRSYEVIGVLSSTGMVSAGITPDESVFFPYETGIKYIAGKEISPVITAISRDVNGVAKTKAAIEKVLSETYSTAEFVYTDAGSKMEAAESSNEILTLLLAAMAVIVFIVGGIGIMNVLFVSVKERTGEIGILKAIGASRGTILMEFLMESAAISLLGGVLGVALSFVITPLVEWYGIRVEPNFTAWLSALGFAVLTGTLFGFYPAWKASRLVPVEALNAE